MARNQQKITELIEKSLGIKVDRKKKFHWLKNKPLPEYFGKYYGIAMDIFSSLCGDKQGLADKR
ncbi:MAG: hypothetical protein QMC90_02215, partial [Dehalococcoidales bacterium]|nr:hypothetical protein [Dehalococcoidales bacterium]